MKQNLSFITNISRLDAVAVMKYVPRFKTFLQDFQSSLIEAKFDDFLMNIFLKIFLYYTANFQFCMNDIIQKQATV